MTEQFLHTATDGVVWGLRCGGVPQVAAKSALDYADNTPINNLTTRLLSCADNNQLQHELLCRGSTVAVVGGAVTRRPIDTPFYLLMKVSQCGLSASLGGWWTCNELDRHNFRSRNNFVSVLEHPVIAKLPELTTIAAKAMLVDATDPRRFIDPSKPYSSCRFKAFIGLRPRIFFSHHPHPFLRCLDDWPSLDPVAALQSTECFADYIWRKWLALTIKYNGH